MVSESVKSMVSKCFVFMEAWGETVSYFSHFSISFCNDIDIKQMANEWHMTKFRGLKSIKHLVVKFTVFVISKTKKCLCSVVVGNNIRD